MCVLLSCHFTHVFVDEAGHAVETECLVPSAGKEKKQLHVFFYCYQLLFMCWLIGLIYEIKGCSMQSLVRWFWLETPSSSDLFSEHRQSSNVFKRSAGKTPLRFKSFVSIHLTHFSGLPRDLPRAERCWRAWGQQSIILQHRWSEHAGELCDQTATDTVTAGHACHPTQWHWHHRPLQETGQSNSTIHDTTAS